MRELPYAVDWDERYGAECPKCKRYTMAYYSDIPWNDEGRKARYHKCPTCGYNFQSWQERSAKVEPEEWQLENLRSYVCKDGRIKKGGHFFVPDQYSLFEAGA